MSLQIILLCFGQTYKEFVNAARDLKNTKLQLIKKVLLAHFSVAAEQLFDRDECDRAIQVAKRIERTASTGNVAPA